MQRLRVLWVLTVALSGRDAAAAASQLRLSLIGDPRQTIGIAWTTPDASAGAVQYGPTTAYGSQQAAAAPALVDGVGYVHEAVLTGLLPGTSYHYRVGDGATWSEDSQFATAPADPCVAWRFVAMGDDRTNFGEGGHPGVSAIFGSILAEAAATAPAFMINTGDLVLDGAVAEQWTDYLDTTGPVARRTPILPTIGNHDNDTQDGDLAKYNGVFHLPRNEVTHTEDYYVVRYLNTVIAVLSSQTFLGGTATDRRTLAQQSAWLDQMLTAHADATWKIVAYHHPSVTGGGFTILGYGIGHEANEFGGNEALLPVLDRHHVDLVLVGHNHWYERFLPARQDPGAPGQVTLADSAATGTVYVTAGGAGAYTMEFDWIPFMDVCHGDVDGLRATCSGAHHFVVADVADNRLELTTWSTSCQNFDCDNQPSVIDRYQIVKPATAQCQPRDAGTGHDGNAGRDSGGGPDATSPDRPLADRRDAGLALEASAGSDTLLVGGDAGIGTVAQEGCHCRAQARAGWWLTLGWGVVLLGWWRRRRRQFSCTVTSAT